MRWRIYWTLDDCGNNDIEAENPNEAIRKFREISLIDLVGGNYNIAKVMRVQEAVDHRLMEAGQ